jgi:hypothetical protein
MSLFFRRLPLLLTGVGLMAVCFEAPAQIYRTYDKYVQSVKLTDGSKEFTSAWAGGFNTPQFALADIDHDGKEDMVVYEQDMGVKTFRNVGASGSDPKYQYSPDLEYLFPAVQGFIKILDYNNDNIPDIFFNTGASGLMIGDGFYNNQNLLTFRNVREIRYQHSQFSGMVNVGISREDIPAIVDVDNDGDIDVLSYSQFDADMVWWYKNMCKEESLPATDFKLKVVSQCWGKQQAGYAFARPHFLGINCTALKEGNNTPQHKTTGVGAHAFTLLHLDNDGDYDMLDGYKEYSDIQVLINGKNNLLYPIDTFVSEDTIWAPGGVKIDMPRFPVGYWLDVDHDGDNDLLVAPHTPKRTGISEDVKCVAYYKNEGAASAPSFVYQNDSFLISDILDLGSDTRPLVYDFDKDGLSDLLVGSVKYNRATDKHIPQLAFLKNTSSGGKISFELKSRDVANISTSFFDGIAPAVGDLDNDGKDDLVIGKADGTLSYYRNFAASNSAPPVWQQWQVNMTTKFGTIIDMSEYATPCFYDVDKDGKDDLVVGGIRGFLSYFRNEGTVPGEIKLVEMTNKLGGVFVGFSAGGYDYDGYSAPFIGRIDNIPQDYLLVGNNYGKVYKYSGIDQGYNNNAPYVRLDTDYVSIKGMNAAPVAGDFDGDTTMREMFVGNVTGGMFAFHQIFKQDVNDMPVVEANKLNLYPNPAGNELYVSLESLGDGLEGADLKVYNLMGQKMTVEMKHMPEKVVRINIENLPQGLYLCTLTVNGKTYNSTFAKK